MGPCALVATRNASTQADPVGENRNAGAVQANSVGVGAGGGLGRFEAPRTASQGCADSLG